MRKLLAVLLLVASSAYADGVIRAPDGTMVVFKKTPCVHEKVVALIRDEYVRLFQTAGVLYQGKMYHACWAADPNNPDAIHLIIENGETGVFPRGAIAFDPEA